MAMMAITTSNSMSVNPRKPRRLPRGTGLLEEEQRTAGGIIIPDTAREKPIQGEVTAAGLGKLMDDGSRRPLDVKVGDRILFGKYAGTDIKVEGEELLIMREDDVLAIIEK